MNNKRKEFLNRLLRISQINEQIANSIDHNHNQPVYTKRIKIMQVAQCHLRLPDKNHHPNPQKHNCQILVLSNSNRKHISRSVSCSSKTIPQPQIPTDKSKTHLSPQSSNAIPLSKQFKLCIDKKRYQLNPAHSQNQDINFVSPMYCQNNFQQIQYKQAHIPYQHNLRNNQIRPASHKKSQHQQIPINQPSTPNTPVTANQTQNLIQHLQIMQVKPSPATIEQTRPERRYFKSNHHNNYFTQQKDIQEQKKIKLSVRKQLNKNYGKPFIPPPKLTAKSYIACEILGQNQPMKVVVAYNSKNSQQVASLTKIMTCIITVQFCQQNGVNRDQEQIKIGKYQSSIGGTSAELRQGQIYTVNQLLYGLMLPSGNDASLALAVWCGRSLLTKQRNELQSYQSRLPKYEPDSPQRTKISRCLSTNSSLRSEKLTKGQCYSRFVRQMNEKAATLKMIRTRYMNSHGLINMNNRSTAYDIALISEYAMRNATFREIVSCPVYETTIKSVQVVSKPNKVVEEEQAGNVSYNQNQIQENIEEDSNSPDSPLKTHHHQLYSSIESPLSCSNIEPPIIKTNIRWQNTHRLLHSQPNQYIGIKTGFTTNAGPCLSSCITLQGRTFIIVVLGCAKMSLRFKQTEIIKRWLSKHQGITKTSKQTKALQLHKRVIHRSPQKSEDSFSEWQQSKQQLDEE